MDAQANNLSGVRLTVGPVFHSQPIRTLFIPLNLELYACLWKQQTLFLEVIFIT